MGEDGGPGDAALERGGMVAGGRTDAGRVPAPGAHGVEGHKGVAGAERAQARLDGIFGAACDPVWADATRDKYRAILFKFLLWQEQRGLGPGEGESEGKATARGLTRFIRGMAGKLSGEALRANTRALLLILRAHISNERRLRILSELPLLRKRANALRPPRAQAAEAVCLETLKELVWRAGQTRLSREERQALDIFQIAFVTVSRVGEIAALCAAHVAEDGAAISIRPKTLASTGRRLEKVVTNTEGLATADILREYRRRAVEQGRARLFVGRDGEVPSTAAITRGLKKASRRLGFTQRITSHSARKGAAVEAILAGVPLPVVQALGAWRDINSLQAYIGESVRRSTALLSILGKHRAAGEGHRASRWRGRDKAQER